MTTAVGLTIKEKQEKIKLFPNQLKGETAALTALSKGLGEIQKTKNNESKNKSTPLTGISTIFDTKTEVTPMFTRLFKYVNQQQSLVSQSNVTKAAQLNEVKGQCDTLIKKIAVDSKDAQQKAKESRLSGPEIVRIDVRRLKAHRDLLADWMYTEMEEHAKKLETYADIFDKAQNGIDVDDEFIKAIMDIDKF